MIVSCAAGQGDVVHRRAGRARRRDRLRARSPSRSAAAAGSGSRPGARGAGRRLRAERRRARRRRLRRAARAAPRDRRRGDDRRRAAAVAVRRRRARRRRRGHRLQARAARIPYWVNCGVYVLCEEAIERLPERGDHETTHVPGARRRGAAARLPARGPLADREHAEGAAPRGGARRRASRVAGGVGSPCDARDLSSPNLTGVDRFAFDPRTVEKPWGSELIWALTDAYAGKILFVKAGESLSLQFHDEKDESWYVLEGRARARARRGRARGSSSEEVIAPGEAFRFPPGHGAPRDRARGHARSSRSRRRSSTTSSGSRTATGARAPPNLDTVVVRLRPMELTVGEAATADGLVGPDAPLPRGRRARRAGAAAERLPRLRPPRAEPAPLAARAARALRRRARRPRVRRAAAARARRCATPSHTWLAGARRARSSGSSASTSGCWPPETD